MILSALTSVLSANWQELTRTLDFLKFCASPMDLAKDFFTLGLPAVLPWIDIPLGKVFLDISNKLPHVAEAPVAYALFCDVAEESLHKIEPRASCRREVYLEPAMSCQPPLHAFFLMGTIVVNDEVNVHILWRFSLDLLEKSQPLDVRVLIFGTAYDLTIKVVEGGEEGNRAMASIVMSCGPAVAPCTKGQCRLRTFECLALTLLIAAKHKGLCRRVEIQADYIPELLLESRVVGKFECLCDVRLDIVCPPEFMHGVVAHALGFGHFPRGPLGVAFGRARGFGNDLSFGFLADRRLAPAAPGFAQPGDSAGFEAFFPLAHDRAPHAHLCGGFTLAEALGS